jgi:predicted transposase YbfD/YdcC
MSSPLSLLDVLAEIPDPRHRRGIRHPLPALLGLAVLAMLTGCKSYQAIAQFGRDKGFALAQALGFRRGKTPTKTTYAILFRRWDGVAFEAAVARWIASRLSDEPMSVQGQDGKTLRGSREGVMPGQYLVAAHAVKAAAVLAQVRVDAKTNEPKAALQLLGLRPVVGRIITGDAMFCQRDLCQKIVDEGGETLSSRSRTINRCWRPTSRRVGVGKTSSGGRPLFFPPNGEPARASAASTATTVNKGHGRQQRRTLRRTTMLAKTQDGMGLRQGFELTRERTVQGLTTQETVYGITSLSVEQSDASRLLALTRGHWEIENGLHYQRDVTLGEDASRIREEAAPQVMAALRNSVVHRLDGTADSLAAAVRTMSNCFNKALALLGLPQLE